MFFSYLKDSWEAYRKNLASFVIAESIAFVVIAGIVGVGMSIVFTTIGISSPMELKPSFLISNIVSLFPFILNLSIAMVFFLVACLVSMVFFIGILGMAFEASRGATTHKTMFTSAKEFFGVGMIVLLMIFLIGLVLMIILIGILGILLSVPGLVGGTIIFFLIMIFFSLALPAVIVDRLGPIEAIEKSLSVVRKNYPTLLLLLLFYSVLTLAFFSVPFVGQVMWYFTLLPMLCITLILFYRKNRF